MDIKVGDTVAFRGPYGTEQGEVKKVDGDRVTVRSAAGQTHTVDRSKVQQMKSFIKSVKE